MDIFSKLCTIEHYRTGLPTEPSGNLQINRRKRRDLTLSSKWDKTH